MSETAASFVGAFIALLLLAAGYAGFTLNERNTPKNVMDYLLIIEPAAHEVLGDLVWHGDRYVFVDCFGRVYEIPDMSAVKLTQDLCA